MPVSKCPDGKWKIGSGPCRYDSKEKAEAAWEGARAANKSLSVDDELNQLMHGFGPEPIYTKPEAGYQEGIGLQALQCGDCEFYNASRSCAIVKGDIDPGALCNFYEQAKHMGSMPAHMARSQFDMFISKASQDPETGEKRWAAVASDTDLDAYDDRMSIELFENFISRIEADEVAPAVFTSEVWQGGLPYLGLAHYLDLDGEGIVGDSNSIYIDGNRLKAKGLFRSSPLGEAAFEAVKNDQKSGVDPDERIRISIAFVDWAHDHGQRSFVRESLMDECPMCAEGIGDKIYKSGHLVHLALTRVPVNERTPIWLEERAMPKTMKEDAVAVLGEEHEELVENLDELSKKKKKTRTAYRSEAVVVKSDEDVAEEAEEEEEQEPELVARTGPFGGATSFDQAEKNIKQMEESEVILDTFSMLDAILYNIHFSEEVEDKPAAMKVAVSEFKARVDSSVKRSLAVRAAKMILESEHEEGEPMTEKEKLAEKEVNEPVIEELTPLDSEFAKLKAAVLSASDQSIPLEERFKGIQPAFDSLAEVVKSTVKGEKAADAEAMASAVAKAVADQLAPVTEAIQLLAAKSERMAPKPDTPMIPGPRAFVPPPAYMAEDDKPKSSLTSMIRKSVGLKD